MSKEYQFVCKICDGIYTTSDINQAICRSCWSKTGLPRQIIEEKYRPPQPTPLQAAKWRKARKAIKEIKK